MNIKKIKPYILIIIFGLAIALILAVWEISSKTNTQQPSFVKAPGGIVPQKTTIEQASEALGDPIGNEGDKYFYRLNNLQRSSTAYFKGGTLSLFIETSPNTTSIANIQKQYGPPVLTLYGEISNSGYNLYVYPSVGFAYTGNPASNEVLELWYFAPTTSEDFASIRPEGYSLRFPQIGE